MAREQPEKVDKIRRQRKRWIAVGILLLAGIGVMWTIWGVSLYAAFEDLAGFLKERERLEAYMLSFGPYAPLIFMGIQVTQVVLAPIPGEATGFVGGYLFGIVPGLVYSSTGLFVGSLINFYLGRFVGRRYLKLLVSEKTIEGFRHLLRRQGFLVAFLLFLIPGFPKDTLCLVIGLGSMPVVAFLIINTLGRIPGTLLLSIQGASVHEQHYMAFAIVALATLIIGIGVTLNKQRIYTFLERLK